MIQPFRSVVGFGGTIWFCLQFGVPSLISVPSGCQNQEAGVPAPILRTLTGGEKHIHPLVLNANDCVQVIVDQHGIDVVVRLLGPDGDKLQEVDSLNGTDGPEPLTVIVAQSGAFRIEIESLEKTARPGKYEFKLTPPHPATKLDRAEVDLGVLNAKLEQLQSQGKTAQALELAQPGVARAEQVFGSSGPYVLARSLTILGGLHFAAGEYARAEPCFERARVICEQTFGVTHLETAGSLNNLAVLATEKGNFEKAESLYRQSLAISEQVVGPEHPQVAAITHNLADVLEHLGRYSQAEILYRQALTIREKVFGPHHLETAATLHGLAVLYDSTGEYPRAEELYQRALGIREKALGRIHPLTVATLNNLALLADKSGDLTTAERLYQQVLAINEANLGEHHPGVAVIVYNLAALYRDQGDYTKAEPLYQRALAIFEKRLGPDHPRVAACLSGLALLYQF
ncbi:MAG TPA: tetratricopeptide repeat protein, partial [Acidobacteriota bacterium]|nr:tetratricopeptide repeat protein [Acidobacteriota bacterium]